MSQKANNDIDILLRKLSRQNRDALKALQEGQHTEHAHLDADELNAYAENALPGALRARYTEHLTECTSCRKIVTQLSLASAVVVPGRVEEAKPSALKTFLAGLLSPSVFRYAIPAMAILVVVTIAWFAVQRQAPSPSEVAQKVSSGSNAPPTQAELNTNASSDNAQPNLLSNTREQRSRAGEKAADARPEAQEAEPKEAEEKKLAATAADDLRNRQDLKRDQPQPPVAAPAGAGATVEVRESPKPDAAAARRAEVAQKKESDADKNKVMTEPQDRVSTQSAPPPKSPATRSANKRAISVGSETTRSVLRENTAKDESEGTEVRTVGGHRFHKKGEVWVDSQYSSQPITNVSRGSEQYRALVADEPGIRSIAEQLKSEFIVVWNGRAYRIR